MRYVLRYVLIYVLRYFLRYVWIYVWIYVLIYVLRYVLRYVLKYVLRYVLIYVLRYVLWYVRHPHLILIVSLPMDGFIAPLLIPIIPRGFHWSIDDSIAPWHLVLTYARITTWWRGRSSCSPFYSIMLNQGMISLLPHAYKWVWVWVHDFVFLDRSIGHVLHPGIYLFSF